MRRAIVVLVAVAALALLPAAAIAAPQQQTRLSPVVCLHVVDPAHLVDRSDLRRSEAAIVHQVNMQVRPVWNTPQIRFCDWGWPIYIKKGPGPLLKLRIHGHQAREDGYHGHTWHPYAVVYVKDNRWPFRSLDHEVLEMLVDPWYKHVINKHSVEICDPVEYHPYNVDGVLLPDWVTPLWFAKSAKAADVVPGRTDWLGVTNAPLQVRGGFVSARANGPGSSDEDRGQIPCYNQFQFCF